MERKKKGRREKKRGIFYGLEAVLPLQKTGKKKGRKRIFQIPLRTR